MLCQEALAKETVWQAMKRGWKEGAGRRPPPGAPVRLDTSAVNPQIYTSGLINRGLNGLGLPSLMSAPKVQKQSIWIRGRGFVDITAQAQAQVDRDFQRYSNGRRPTGAVIIQPGQKRRPSGRTIDLRPIVQQVLQGSDEAISQQIDWSSVQNRSLVSLMEDPAAYNTAAFAEDYESIGRELSSLDQTELVRRMFGPLDRPSLRWIQNRSMSNGTIAIQFRTLVKSSSEQPTGCVIYVHRSDDGKSHSWQIQNVSIDANQTTLDSVYQSALLASLRSNDSPMPVLSRWVSLHPAKDSAASDGEIAGLNAPETTQR